jgi:hypothetical protein
MDGFQPGVGPSRSQRIGVIALIAVAAFFIWRSLADLPLGTIDNPGPGAMPLVLAALLAIFALWSLGSRQTGLLDESAGGGDTVIDPDHAAEEAGARRHALLIVGSIVAAAFALDTIGYRLTILALLLVFLGLVERKPIVTVLIVSFGLSFGSHYLFDHLLKISLPSGPFGI